MERLDLDRIREYNKNCNEQKRKLAQLIAERNIKQENLNRLCSQLSQQLGMEVTVDNIEKVYEDKVQSVNNILEAGEGILKRIKESEEPDEQIGEGPVGEGQVVEEGIASGIDTGFTGFGGTSGNGQGNSMGQGLPQSGYVLPSGFGGNMAGASGFGGASGVSGAGQVGNSGASGIGSGQVGVMGAHPSGKPAGGFMQNAMFKGSFSQYKPSVSDDSVDEI